MNCCRLGTSSEGAHLRARMQSACLLSDMEAFKAANPGCSLGDFVRWYSPRDWIEEEIVDDAIVVKGQCGCRQRFRICSCSFFFSFYSHFLVGSMYDDIRLHVARSYTSSADSPFSLISSFTLSNHLLLGLPLFLLP